jgi:predicted component of type VI protein secretion system
MHNVVKLTTALAAALLLTVVATGCKKEEKTETPQQAPAAKQGAALPFKAHIAAAVPASVAKGSASDLTVTIRNLSDQRWSAKGPTSVRLSYHWRDWKTNKAVVWDGLRTYLVKDLAPGEEAQLSVKVEAPKEPGVYALELDLVAERIGWFSKNGSPMSRHRVEVK